MMAEVVIYYNGAYNIYSTVADGPLYESALSREQVIKELIRRGSWPDGIDKRLARAEKKGCSLLADEVTLEMIISENLAGPGETMMEHDEFIRRYLTIAPE